MAKSCLSLWAAQIYGDGAAVSDKERALLTISRQNRYIQPTDVTASSDGHTDRLFLRVM